jgi:hypothetical protein
MGAAATVALADAVLRAAAASPLCTERKCPSP